LLGGGATYIVFGAVFILLGVAQLFGIFGTASEPFMPLAFNIGVPAFLVLIGVWRLERIERRGILALAATFFVGLNRASLGLGVWASPIILAGASYLIYFGVSHPSGWRQQMPQVLWHVLVSFVLVAAILAVVVFGTYFLM
jgi:hypothetical protein